MVIVAILILIAAALIFAVLVIGGWWVGTFNTFKVGIQDIKTQWSNILTEYQRRADLFYNLSQGVKSFKKHERETLTHVIAARSGNFGTVKADQMKKLGQLDQVFQKLMVLIERYPTIQAGKQHDKLMEEIRITEDRINIARTDYNEIVGDYNKLVTTFPSLIIAWVHKFNAEIFFQNEAGTEKAPKIELD